MQFQALPHTFQQWSPTNTADEPIIAGHDSKLGYESLEEAIVKDSDKLYRYSAAAVSWFMEYAGMESERYVTLLAESAEGWFFTELGRRMAAAELAARLAELK